MSIYQIIVKPIYTERGMLLKEKENRYVFRVNPSANKLAIKEAVQNLFKVDVEKVNTAMVRGKRRRMGAHEGLQPEWKKALVRIKKGQEIRPIEG
ncbi:MAG: 50S ribosomal protein L23 [Elusimicrobia bacterium]|nr:50S ribosomal protein L23 [Elusimicrobiota bacterium]